MALLDIFKKNKGPKKKRFIPKKKRDKEPVGKSVEKKVFVKEKEAENRGPSIRKKPAINSGQVCGILKSPHVTEKASGLTTNKNQYVFKVSQGACKKEIGKTIEDLYGVEVLKVRVIKIPSKKRRLGRIEGWKKGYKKAIIMVKKGQKIEVLPR